MILNSPLTIEGICFLNKNPNFPQKMRTIYLRGDFKMKKKIEVDFEHYEMLVKELEILQMVGKIIIATENKGYEASEVLSLITKVVFKEYDFNEYDITNDNKMN